MIKLVLHTTSMIGHGAERVMATLFTHHPSDIDTMLILSYSKIDYEISKKNLITISKSNKDKLLINKLLNSLYTFIYFFKYIHIIKPNISVSFLEIPNIINVLSCLFTKTKCITSLRNNPSFISNTQEKIAQKLSLFLSRYFSQTIIVNSEDIRNLLITEYKFKPHKVTCINNPKEINSILCLKNETVDESFFNTNEIILFTAGRLDEQKGHVYLLRTFAKLREKYPCKLAIAGTGKLETKLILLANDLKIKEHILFLGFQKNVYKYMNKADIFVLSSLGEGQPNVLIEALICGCPCVSTDCDFGPREILENGKYGLLSKKITKTIKNPNSDPLTDEEMDLYNKIEILINNKNLREEFSKKTVELYDKFDEKNIIKKYYDTFLEGIQQE